MTEVKPPVVGERWVLRDTELPSGSHQQVIAWLLAALTPRVVAVHRVPDDEVHYAWLHGDGAADVVPVHRGTLRLVAVPDPDTMWVPATGSMWTGYGPGPGATFALGRAEFMDAFRPVPGERP